jgi:xanthine dehydrogenase FAD-binding subunit
MFDLASYEKAGSLEHAIELLEANPLALPIAGGTDVLVRLHEGNQAYAHLVDIHGLKELHFVRKEDDGTVVVGSGMTFSELIENPIVNECLPVLAKGASCLGGPQVRNSATIGGNLCNAAPCADSSAPMLVMEAVVHLVGPKGERQVPLTEYFTGPGQVIRGHAEIMTGLSVTPENYQGWSTAYFKYAIRGAMDIATIGCGAALKTSGGKVVGLRMAYTVAAPTPLRCAGLEAWAIGQSADDTLPQAAADRVLKDLTPRDSWRASKDFREHIIQELARRVLAEALAKDGETS